jgi:mRNA interferase MazF
MMKKDFADWHDLKTKIQGAENSLFFREREIWLCYLGLNLGHEEDGKQELFLRPVIVFRKFSPNFFWGIPLTSKEKDGSYYYHSRFAGKVGTALLFQMRLMDRKRLFRKIGTMHHHKFLEMAGKVGLLLPNENPSI